jgi:hypothetical protein
MTAQQPTKNYHKVPQRSLIVHLDDLTYSLLDLAAVVQNISMQELAGQILYRDMAARTGWPGQDGLRMRKGLADLRSGTED